MPPSKRTLLRACEGKNKTGWHCTIGNDPSSDSIVTTIANCNRCELEGNLRHSRFSLPKTGRQALSFLSPSQAPRRHTLLYFRSHLPHSRFSLPKTGRQALPYLSLHQAQKEHPAHPSPAPRRNALSRPIKGKNKTGWHCAIGNDPSSDSIVTTIANCNRCELEGARNLFPAPSLKLGRIETLAQSGTAIVVTMKISEETGVSNSHLS